MRFIEIGDDGKLSLTRDLYDTEIGFEYAILSHTWALDDEEEVTFKDLQENTGKNKTGYQKLWFCAQQAQKHDLRNFWVDTCCIDKSSSNELSTAIMSMFRWYRSAAKCYVYLSDVSRKPDVELSAQQPWKSAFRKCRWFTRGWTLQELIAPKSVEFFSAEGELLGSKETLKMSIHEITGLPLAILQRDPPPLSHFTIDQRLQWRKGRITRRIEDQAYCLLGILDVDMSLRYGEEERAFRRLKKKLTSQRDKHVTQISNDEQSVLSNKFDRSIVAAEMSYRPLKQSSPHFTGREDFIDLLSNFFASQRKPGQRRRDFVLYGLGGCGKTQICLKFAEENRNRFWKIFWIDATSPTTLDLSLSGTSQDSAARLDSVENTKESVAQWLSIRDSEWLLIFDNADTEPETIEKYLPIGSRGNILLTTRNPNMRQIVERGAFAHVEKMTETEAISLLVKAGLVDDKSDQNMNRLKDIVQELGLIPLAIHHAASAIARGYCNLYDYLTFFRQQPLQLLNNPYYKGASQYDRNLISAWETSQAAIQRHTGYKVALHLFRIFAFLHPNGIMEDIFRRAANILIVSSSGKESDVSCKMSHAKQYLPRSLLRAHGKCWDALIFKQGITLLFKYSFIQIDASGQAYSIHPLVQYWKRHRMSKNEKVRTCNQAIALLTTAAGSQGDKDAFAFRRELVAHVNSLHLLQAEVKVSDHYFDDACESFWALYAENERWHDAEKTAGRMLENRQSILGILDPATICAMERLARSLSSLGCYDKAEKLQLKVLIYRRVFQGLEHERTLDSTSALATIYFQQARYREAETLQLQVWEAHRRDSGCSELRKMESAAALSSIYHGQNRYDDAARILNPSLSYLERIVSSEPLAALAAMATLAAAYHELYLLEEATALKFKILQIRMELQGNKHPATLMATANLTATYVRQGRLDEAIRLVEPLIETRKEVLGERHRDTLSTLLILTNIYIKQGKWEAAEHICEQVVHGREAELPLNHPHTLWSKAHLALIYHHQGRLDESSKIWTDVVSAQEKVRGIDHMETLLSNHNLALVMKSQGQRDLALELMKTTLESRSKTLGPDHLRTIESLHVLKRWEQMQSDEITFEAPSPLVLDASVIGQGGFCFGSTLI